MNNKLHLSLIIKLTVSVLISIYCLTSCKLQPKIKSQTIAKDRAFLPSLKTDIKNGNLQSPYASKGLTPVKYTIDKKLKPLLLLKEGKAYLSIVVPQSKSKYYNSIGKLLQTYLKKATGADFKIVNKVDEKQKGIFIGPCNNPTVYEIFKKAQDGKPESFIIHSFSKGIILAGNDKINKINKAGTLDIAKKNHNRGTFFATIDFIERLVGYRFYYTGEMGEHIPNLKNSNFEIPAINYSDSPVFSYRMGSYQYAKALDYQYIPTEKKDRLFNSLLMRLGDINYATIGHTDGYWHTYFAKDHPEYFALRKNGTRMIGKQGHLSSQRCYSSEAGLQQHLKNIENYDKNQKEWKLFASKRLVPNSKYIYWFPQDGFKGCECKQCQSKTMKKDPKAKRYDPDHSRRHSKLVFDYAKRLAQEIKKRWPDRQLKIPLYSSYRIVPDDINFPDNISLFPVHFGDETEAFFKEDKLLNAALKDIDKNIKMSSERVIYWSHYPHRPRISNRLSVPTPIPHILQKMLNDNKEKIGGVYLNGHSSFSYSLDGIMLYIYYKLLWNPELNVDNCISEYCDLLYGPAANDMKKYFAIIIDRWENVKWSSVPNPPALAAKVTKKFYFKESYPRFVRLELKKLLANGLAKTKANTIYRKRMTHMVNGIQDFFVQGDLFDAGGAVKGEVQKSSPRIDGKLNEWNKKKGFELVSNRTGKKTNIETLFFTASDKDTLYIAGDVREPNSIISKGKKQPRDFPLWKHDSIEIYICGNRPGLDEAGISLENQYHQIIFDVDGSIFDGYKSISTHNLDKKVNIDFDLQIQKNKNGFTFEIAIPYKSLNAIIPKSGTKWKINFYRNRSRKGVPDAAYGWSPTTASFNDTSKFATLIFPEETLVKYDFQDNVPNFKISHNEFTTVTKKIVNGKMVIDIKVENNDAIKSREIKFDIPNFSVPKITKNARLELAFRYKGEGLERIRAFIADRKNKVNLVIPSSHLSVGQKETGWVILKSKEITPKEKFTKPDFLRFAIKVSKNANFTLELDHITLFGK